MVLVRVPSNIAPLDSPRVEAAAILTEVVVDLASSTTKLPLLRTLSTRLRAAIITFNKNPANSELLKLTDRLNCAAARQNVPAGKEEGKVDDSSVEIVGYLGRWRPDFGTAERGGFFEPRHAERRNAEDSRAYPPTVVIPP